MSEFQAISDADLELLRQHDTPTVCNTIELFEIRPRTAGYMDGRIRSCFPEMEPMVGYATTATYRSSSAPREAESTRSLEAQAAAMADLPRPSVVVFQDLDDPPVAATFGDVMCSTYQAFGSVGLISSGAGRDLEQVRALGFPIFTNGAICAHGYSQTLQINIPVRVGGVTVRPGDLLHGDANGVTTIPPEAASRIARACPQFVGLERPILEYVKSGKADAEGLGQVRRQFAQQWRDLAAKVQREQ